MVIPVHMISNEAEFTWVRRNHFRRAAVALTIARSIKERGHSPHMLVVRQAHLPAPCVVARVSTITRTSSHVDEIASR